MVFKLVSIQNFIQSELPKNQISWQFASFW